MVFSSAISPSGSLNSGSYRPPTTLPQAMPFAVLPRASGSMFIRTRLRSLKEAEKSELMHFSSFQRPLGLACKIAIMESTIHLSEALIVRYLLVRNKPCGAQPGFQSEALRVRHPAVFQKFREGNHQQK